MTASELSFSPNRLYFGDCLDVLRGWPAECVDLVYLDPPFNSKANYNILYGGGNSTPAQVRAFTDTWHWDEAAAARMEAAERATARPSHRILTVLRTVLGDTGMLAYLSYMAERLEECRRVMRSHASLYLHCDPTASHYLKLLCDSVFGPRNFRNEIIWKRSSAHSDTKQGAKSPGRIHDTLLFYTNSERWTWNPQYTAYDDEYIQRAYRHVEEGTGRRYRFGDLTQARPGGNTSYEWRIKRPKGGEWRGDLNDEWRTPVEGWQYKGVPPCKGRYWAYSVESMRAYERQGRLCYAGTGMPNYRRYVDEMQDVVLPDIWTDIQPVIAGQERLGYPTQKPLALLARIIETSSNPGDMVLDPFCGCGTTVAAAELAKRQWVGIDISPFAVKLARDRRLRPMGRDTEVAGIPTDMEGAETLLDRSPLDFEAWAVTSIVGLAPNERRVGDRGIDGRGAMMHQPDGESSRLVVAQFKGGGYTASSMRDFQRVIEREKAAAGVYITLRKVITRGARQAATEMGTITIGTRQYPKLQLWSVEELLEGKLPRLPDMADPYTGKRVRQAELFE